MIVILKPGVSLQAMGELVKFIESQGLRVGRIVHSMCRKRSAKRPTPVT